ncbi:hypothetical protein G5I_03305 [Acromyrmex echinatior]|uniref:Uncharacterized protein n=1 Tax=Acromyrmex echinatior TaxID=103372 RepID=F4WCM9_ACREC|nr:hypothetical protein G5I_03305 [Acromyrmex echinatior]
MIDCRWRCSRGRMTRLARVFYVDRLGDNTCCNVLTPRHVSLCMKLYRSVIQCRAAIFLPDGASTNGTIARQPRSGKEQGAAKEAVGRDWEARKRSLGRGRGGGKRGGEGGRQRKEGDAGCVRVVPCGIGRSQNAGQEIEHVYNVSIKCHVHKLRSTRHHMLFRIFLNNQYSDDSLPFYSKKLFKEKLLVHLADNDPDACVHLTFLRSYQRGVGRGWFIEGGPYAGVSEQIQTTVFGVHFGCSSVPKHFDESSMKSAAALLFVGGVISQRFWYKELAIVEVDRSRRSTIRDRWTMIPGRHGMSRQEKSLHGRCPKISIFVMGQLCVYEMRIMTHEKCYASFSENTILYDKILFLAAVVQCTSSSRQDLEVTESCQALDGRCGAINPNKPAGILCRQKVSQERNRLSKQEVDLPAIVALPLMPASRMNEKRTNIDLVTLESTTLQLELFWVQSNISNLSQLARQFAVVSTEEF